MPKHKIAYMSYTDREDTSLVLRGLTGLDYEMSVSNPSSIAETIEAVRGADLIINVAVPMPHEVVVEIDSAKVILARSHGFDHIDLGAATERGIAVGKASFCTDEVAEHTIMMVLACAKKLTLLNGHVRAGRWDRHTPSLLVDVPTLAGKVMGIIGFGDIGRNVARKAQAFGMTLIAYDPYLAAEDANRHGVEFVDDLRALASRSDFVSMLAPLTGQTRKMVGRSFFRAMKSTAYFINTSRGGTVDEQALIEALNRGAIAGAGLDVFEQEPTPSSNPLLKMDNVIVTPHSAGTSSTSIRDAQLQIGQEAAHVLTGGLPTSVVNPEFRNNLAAGAQGT